MTVTRPCQEPGCGNPGTVLYPRTRRCEEHRLPVTWHVDPDRTMQALVAKAAGERAARIPGQATAIAVESMPGGARHTDPPTSLQAALKGVGRYGTSRQRLLAAHVKHLANHVAKRVAHGDLTDEEACALAGLDPGSEYATRCSELRRLGLIAETGHTRRSGTGQSRMTSKATELGVRVSTMILTRRGGQ